MTMRSGRMKSSTAAPSFRNSGFDATANGDRRRRARASSSAIGLAHAIGGADRHRRLVDDRPWTRSSARPMSRAAASTYCMSAEPSSSGGVPTAMNCSMPCATAASTSVVNAGARRDVARDHVLQARLVDRHAAALAASSILRGIDVEAQHVVADLGEARAGDEADVAGADHRDLQAGTPDARR